MKAKRILGFLLCALVSLGALAYITFNISPQKPINTGIVQIPPVVLVFLLSYMAVFSLFTIFLGIRRGIFIALLITGYLILLYFHYRQPFYLLLLLAILVVIELSFYK